VRWARPAFAFVGLLPWIRGLVGPELSASVARAIDWVFAALCHHAPDRTLVFRGAAMCVCSRCAGLYAGVFIAAAWSWRWSSSRLRIAFVAGALLMLADVLSQDLGLHTPWHAVRLATGAIVGWAATAWMLLEIERRREAGRLSGRRGDQVDRRETVAG
jgi:uncharacterized membrane protein